MYSTAGILVFVVSGASSEAFLYRQKSKSRRLIRVHIIIIVRPEEEDSRMALIQWENLDADKPNTKLQKVIGDLGTWILTEKGIDQSDIAAVRTFAEREISNYRSGSNSELNETFGIDIFRPHEFNTVSSNDESLAELRDWFLRQSFNWRIGSRAVQLALDNSFPSGGSKGVKGGRESVYLDNLVVIKGHKVAIEIETSTNLDNGYWTLRQALRSGMADYGVMVVPWTPEGSGRADEGKALGRLDREFDGISSTKEGPIYRIAVIRRLDAYRLMTKF